MLYRILKLHEDKRVLRRWGRGRNLKLLLAQSNK